MIMKSQEKINILRKIKMFYLYRKELNLLLWLRTSRNAKIFRREEKIRCENLLSASRSIEFWQSSC